MRARVTVELLDEEDSVIGLGKATSRELRLGRDQALVDARTAELAGVAIQAYTTACFGGAGLPVDVTLPGDAEPRTVTGDARGAGPRAC